MSLTFEEVDYLSWEVYKNGIFLFDIFDGVLNVNNEAYLTLKELEVILEKMKECSKEVDSSE